MHWKDLQEMDQMKEILAHSNDSPQLIFKHSTRCSISVMAKQRLERDWSVIENKVQPWYLDLLQHRDISNWIAEQFDVLHESPQALIIRDGRCIYHSSHSGISVEAIANALQAIHS